MINTLNDYIHRSLPQEGGFSTNPNLRKKVDPAGHLLPFLGNTVVFLLNEGTKQQLQQLQNDLYRAAPEMLAEKLQPSTFHLTLHDLANGTPGQPGLSDDMCKAQKNARAVMAIWTNLEPLPMKATWLFNMVNTSIVLGLAPADENSWRRLDRMYTDLESVVPLGYGLTPHITMAYFRPGTYSPEQVRALAGVLRPVDLRISLPMENLVLQRFTDMNHYITL